MTYKEEIIKLIRASYDQGVADAKQEALAALEQIIAAARADEREACAKVCENYDIDIAAAIRARSNT